MTTTPNLLGDSPEPPNAPRRLVDVALSATLAASGKRKRLAVELLAVPTASTSEEGTDELQSATDTTDSHPYPGQWEICDFRRSPDAPGLTVVLRRRSSTGLGHTVSVYVTAERQASAGQPVQDLVEGDAVEVRTLGPSTYAVVKQA